jgi:hypothetical protein
LFIICNVLRESFIDWYCSMYLQNELLINCKCLNTGVFQQSHFFCLSCTSLSYGLGPDCTLQFSFHCDEFNIWSGLLDNGSVKLSSYVCMYNNGLVFKSVS